MVKAEILMVPLVLSVGLLLAFANGANDNFKGVATIYGSRMTTYRTAIIWATLATLAGAVLSIFIGQGLIVLFSGGGLVGPDVLAHGRLPAVIALAAGLSVGLASLLGMPISTTHAMVGALAGVAIVASSGWGWLLTLGSIFFLPLITSPLLAFVLSWIAVRLAPEITPRCICIAQSETSDPHGKVSLAVTGTESACEVHGIQPLFKTSWVLLGIHFLSSGAVCFMRAMNDTPKVLGVLAAGGLYSADMKLALMVGLAMAVGGVIGSRRIAKTMGDQLTAMSPIQGTICNVLTSMIVGSATKWSLPVSTTHVSCGTIFGLGAARKELSRKWTSAITGSWIFTLPVAATFASMLWLLLASLD